MSKNQDDRTFIYRIDEQDRITFVNDNWLAFAVENDTPHLSRNVVLHKSLWDFIADINTRYIYRIILEKVRARQQSIKIPFRCDSSMCRRFMELEVHPQDNNSIEFKSRMIKQKVRQPASILTVTIDRSNEFVVSCSWCKKISTPSGWLEVEDAIEALQLFETTLLPRITHGICPSCNDIMDQILDDSV